MKIYRIKAFNYFKNIYSSSPKLTTYEGPKHLAVNATNMCVRGVRLPKFSKGINKDYYCREQNYKEPSLSKWRFEYTVARRDGRTDVKMSERGPVAYCYGDLITLNGKTSHCPPWPFQSKISDVFNTTTFNYKGESERYEFSESYLSMPAPNPHGEHNIDDETIDIGKMVELEKELEIYQAIENRTWVDTSFIEITSEGVMGISGVSIFIFLVVAVVLWWKYQVKNRAPTWR